MGASSEESAFACTDTGFHQHQGKLNTTLSPNKAYEVEQRQTSQRFDNDLET